MLVAGGAGIGAVAATLTGRVPGGAVFEIAAGLFGGLLTVLALIGALSWKTLTRDRRLIIEQAGLRWVDPAGTSWALAWPELAAVSISRTVNRRPKLTPAETMVRLDLFPADAGVRQRHPEMEHLWEFHRMRNGYRVPFGQAGELLPRLDAGLRRFGGARYRGVRDEGFTVGLF